MPRFIDVKRDILLIIIVAIVILFATGIAEEPDTSPPIVIP